MDLCKDTCLLILNGRTPGDDTGKHTFVSKSCHGRSATDFFVASGAQPAEPPQRPAASGVAATSCSDDECMFASITAEKLHVCIEKLERGKSPGIVGVAADVVTDGGDLLHHCLLQLFNGMRANSFPEILSVGMITAVL